MSRIVAAFRFVMGVSMVAAGAALAAPLCGRLVTEVARQRPTLTQPAAWPDPAAAAVPPTPEGLAAPAPTLAVEAATAAWPLGEDVAGVAAPVPLDPHYQPPPPPLPLPPVTGDLISAGPEVAAAYRSTLDVPPPPLLDAQRPPPLAAGWTAHEVAAAPVAEMPAAVVPQTYVIRDGDDLTGIATRFYGHASAATAIWSANRDVVPDPNVLPIGAVVRLPPPWTVLAARGVDPRAIEPQAAAAAAPRPVEPPAPTATRPVGWLPAGQPPVAAAAPGQPVAQRPAAVRVAPGETLATLARRFYGDARQAARIWEANRDRLRSPQLVVAGMELRLP